MTAQYSEILLHNGETLRMCNEPLARLLVQQSVPWKFKKITSTALYRGYIGTWEIEGGRLYLKSMEEDDASVDWKAIPFEQVFPGFPDGIFAHWFTGELRCTRGKLVRRNPSYVYGDVYEDDVYFSLRRGVVTGIRVVSNTQQAGVVS
ncbi:hypothetical protein [Rhodoferax sp.]|uniref:hypothetical protein n=1 Tax=Rhodoferax sp. TaxID=50421 RepID=UPI0025EE85A6|nr:hypothetical protein [Rhodoferax sp.]MCM2341667.1 hypothetical protein [Rhodoferax sp.]